VAGLKRITVIVEDETYKALLDRAHLRSKETMSRVGVGEVIREIVSTELRRRSQPQLPPLKRKVMGSGIELEQSE